MVSTTQWVRKGLQLWSLQFVILYHALVEGNQQKLSARAVCMFSSAFP
jgi:hypothetical protein